MNAVEIEQAISELAGAEYDAAEFPFAFLEAFGNKPVTINRLKSGNSNKSDLASGVLQANNIHILTCDPGTVSDALQSLKASKQTTKAKAKFILATDGEELQAEHTASGETVACEYPQFANHFGFFLPLAGISTVDEIRNNPIDIQATSRLNKLYVELLKENEDWATEARRPDMNHFMARLIFCFFAEDTDIFNGEDLFTKTIEQMSEGRAKPFEPGSVEYVMGQVFKAMNIKPEDRAASGLRPWADQFPYVNGGLFGGELDVPKFSRIARSYLIHAGSLDWQAINPDIFGSMIQAVADDGERSNLGMHYTSVPNILKVLNPLFLDDLREQLEAAGDNARKLLNLRKRMAKIRVFDPACGSGNFLVIAYKEMRAIEAEINERRGEKENRSALPLTNFRGIEINDFPAEIARLALIIAEYQCDVQYRGQKEALAVFLPLSSENWITCGNALRLDWLSICPPTGKGVKLNSDDLFDTPLEQAEIDFENEGGETFICGNPPYLGSKKQNEQHKADLGEVFSGHSNKWKSLDLVSAWFFKAARYSESSLSSAAFVTTKSISQGQQVSILWPLMFDRQQQISFAYSPFNWKNLASKNAGVTVTIIGLSRKSQRLKSIYTVDSESEIERRLVENISPYLIAGSDFVVEPSTSQIGKLPEFWRGNSPTDGGNLLVSNNELSSLHLSPKDKAQFIRCFVGSSELIRGVSRFCIWIEDDMVSQANSIPSIRNRILEVRHFRLISRKQATVDAAEHAHSFAEKKPLSSRAIICVPITSSVNREYLPAGLLPPYTVISNLAFGMSSDEVWPLSIVTSKPMLTWVSCVCARMRTDYRFTNTLAWNTFPVPTLTEKNKADLSRCAEDILLAREAHFPATIADLYHPEKMPDNLRAAHDRNDEVLERIYIGRRFKNDTERLEKLFELYTKMIASAA